MQKIYDEQNNETDQSGLIVTCVPLRQVQCHQMGRKDSQFEIHGYVGNILHVPMDFLERENLHLLRVVFYLP